jgi:hypothetical protein
LAGRQAPATRSAFQLTREKNDCEGGVRTSWPRTSATRQNSAASLGTATRSAFARLKAHSRHQPTNARGAHAACRYTRTMTLSDTITIAIPALPLHTSHREPRSLGRPWPGQSQASAARNRAQRHPRDRDRPRDHLILTQPGLLKDPG